MFSPHLTHLEGRKLRVVLSIVIECEFVVLVVGSQLSNAHVRLSRPLVLAERDQIVCCLIECSFLSVQDENSIAVGLLIVQVECWMDLVQSTLISLDRELHLTDSEWYRLHDSLSPIRTELDVVNELGEYLRIRLR